MACVLGIEQDCNECRMCDKGKIGKKITNYEKIKGMSVEELADFLLTVETYGYNCYSVSDGYSGFKEWLESECDAGWVFSENRE